VNKAASARLILINVTKLHPNMGFLLEVKAFDRGTLKPAM
jgi:hypothetical protein